MCVVRLSGTYSCLFLIKSLLCIVAQITNQQVARASKAKGVCAGAVPARAAGRAIRGLGHQFWHSLVARPSPARVLSLLCAVAVSAAAAVVSAAAAVVSGAAATPPAPFVLCGGHATSAISLVQWPSCPSALLRCRRARPALSLIVDCVSCIQACRACHSAPAHPLLVAVVSVHALFFLRCGCNPTPACVHSVAEARLHSAGARVCY